MDYSSKEGFVSKAKWIFSSLSGIIMLWASGLPSPMQIPRPKLCHCRLHQSGLKTLIYSQGEPLIQNPNGPSPIITSHVISPPPLSASPSPSSSKSSLFRSLTHSSSWSSATDDLLGTESGVYMKSDYEQEMIGSVVLDKSVEGGYNRNLTKRSQRCSKMPKKYPPPLSRSHLPRVLTRHYENGNLVLKEKGIKQYFETTRENGRLIVNLMQFDDNIMDMEGGDRMTADEKNNEELEPEGNEFIKKEEQNDDGYEEYQETESDGDFDEAKQKAIRSVASVPRTFTSDLSVGGFTPGKTTACSDSVSVTRDTWRRKHTRRDPDRGEVDRADILVVGRA
ncbi:hypothetical protein CUMW_061180 [Citrus unshiu]|uniref:FAF domain-containing protein n=1 Tax=Citrus unshiu TaxID=55188 RepID=A0A2H5NNB9_CITUN|nr:hypothetical protein CUMW_061180 [Citrus unshiu]